MVPAFYGEFPFGSNFADYKLSALWTKRWAGMRLFLDISHYFRCLGNTACNDLDWASLKSPYLKNALKLCPFNDAATNMVPPFTWQSSRAVHTWSSGATARAWAFPVDGISLTGISIGATFPQSLRKTLGGGGKCREQTCLDR